MRRLYRSIIVYAAATLMAAIVPLAMTIHSDAAQLSLRRLQVSDGTVDTTGVKYDFSFNTNTAGPIGSVRMDICTNYQYEPGDPCTAPNGFDASGAMISNQTGITDFSIANTSNAHQLVLSRPAAVFAAPQQLSFELTGVTNPSDVGSYYVRISTFASTDTSGPETDNGVVVFAMNKSVNISTEVPPYLMFCTGLSIQNYDCRTAEGNLVSFGELSRTNPRTATSQMVAATNAPYGYSVTLAGSTMTAGTNVIPAMTGQASQAGVSQFGLNARSNSSPGVGTEPQGPGLTVPAAGYNTPNQFRFQSGEIISHSDNSDDYRKLTVSYLVNINGAQPPGRYVATVSYICLANF